MLLIVEDNETIQLFLRMLIQRLRWKAIFAKDSDQALQLYNQYEPEISMVFMDWNLPGMTDGLTCAVSLRARSPQLPIVVLTGHASNEHRQQCLKAGMSDFLTKPFTSVEFQAMVNRWQIAEQAVPA